MLAQPGAVRRTPAKRGPLAGIHAHLLAMPGESRHDARCHDALHLSNRLPTVLDNSQCQAYT
jgi:hypothetical protein